MNALQEPKERRQDERLWARDASRADSRFLLPLDHLYNAFGTSCLPLPQPFGPDSAG